MISKENCEAVTIVNQNEKIFGVLHRPLSLSSPAPAIVICPGFAGSKAGKFRIFVTLAKELAKKGIATLRFDYRGSGDSEGDFSDLTLENKVSDTLSCLTFLKQDSQIDSLRIGILGRSLGGVIAVLAASRFPEIKSLGLWAPVFKSDPWRKLWNAFTQNQLDLSQEAIIKALPASIPNLQFLQEFFAFNLVQELDKLKHLPLLHIHGMKDLIVPVEHAHDFESARKNVSQSHFIQLPKSDHDFSDPTERQLAIQETISWYQRTL